jgi:Bacterial SH3 domain
MQTRWQLVLQSHYFAPKWRHLRHTFVAWGIALVTMWLTLLPPAVAAQEVVNTNRATTMRAAPDDAAASLQELTAQTSVQVLERRGAWTRIKIEAATGWVRMMHLRGGVVLDAPATPSKSGSFLAGINRMLGGNQGSQRAQSATLGIRGLSPEELKSAQPNPQALAEVRSFAATKSEAEQHANAAKLVRATVVDSSDAAAKGARP